MSFLKELRELDNDTLNNDKQAVNDPNQKPFRFTPTENSKLNSN